MDDNADPEPLAVLYPEWKHSSIFCVFDCCPRFTHFLICAIRSALGVVVFVPDGLGAFRVQADKNDLGRGFGGELSKKYRERILWGLDSVSEKNCDARCRMHAMFLSAS